MRMALLVLRSLGLHSLMQVYLELNLPMSEELLVWGLCFTSIYGLFSTRSFFGGSIFPGWLNGAYLIVCLLLLQVKWD